MRTLWRYRPVNSMELGKMLFTCWREWTWMFLTGQRKLLHVAFCHFFSLMLVSLARLEVGRLPEAIRVECGLRDYTFIMLILWIFIQFSFSLLSLWVANPHNVQLVLRQLMEWRKGIWCQHVITNKCKFLRWCWSKRVHNIFCIMNSWLK